MKTYFAMNKSMEKEMNGKPFATDILNTSSWVRNMMNPLDSEQLPFNTK